MHKGSQQKNTTLIIPYKAVTGMIMGLVIILLAYIFNNYVIAAPLQQAPDFPASVQTSAKQNHWQTLDNHAHVIVYRDGSAVLSPETGLNVFNTIQASFNRRMP